MGSVYICTLSLPPPPPPHTHTHTQLKSSLSQPDQVSGYSLALAGLLGTVRHSELGLPSTQAKVSVHVYSTGQL